MQVRLSPSILRPAVVMVLGVAATVVPALGAAEDADIPRRPDGKPDLTGVYDIATLTPLVRPERFGDRLALSAEEAAHLAEHWRSSFEKDHRPSDPDRDAPPTGGTEIYAAEFSRAAGKVGGYNAFFVDIGEAAFVLDGKYRTSIITSPKNGRLPELSEEGERRQALAAPFRHENTGTAWWIELEVGPYDDPELRPLAERCLLARGATGPPIRPGMYNNLKRIVQTDEYVMINVEWMHETRIIDLNGELDPEAPPRWSGHSVGHWEGDELVIETTNFREVSGDTRTSNRLRVVERLSRIDRDTLRYSFTVHDPSYTEPWSGEYPWPATDQRLYEYACHEGNYSFPAILRGARLLEREALAGAPARLGESED